MKRASLYTLVLGLFTSCQPAEKTTPQTVKARDDRFIIKAEATSLSDLLERLPCELGTKEFQKQYDETWLTTTVAGEYVVAIACENTPWFVQLARIEGPGVYEFQLADAIHKGDAIRINFLAFGTSDRLNRDGTRTLYTHEIQLEETR